MPRTVGLIPLRKKTKELEQIYYAVGKEFARELSSMDIGNYREMNAIRIEKKTNRLIKGLNRYAIKWTKKAIPLAYKESRLISKTRLEILGTERQKDFNYEIHNNSIKESIDTTIADLVKANMSIKTNVAMYLYLMRQAAQGIMQIQEFGIDDEAVIEGIIEEAIAQGKTRVYASNKIYEHFRVKLLDAQFIQIKGRNYNLRDYSKLTARTRMRQTQTDSVKNTCKEYDNDLVQWSKHSNPCELCEVYEGQVYSLSGASPGYPMLAEDPPLHPNCEHDIQPTSEVAIKIRSQFT